MAVLALLLVAARRPRPKSPDTLALEAELEVAQPRHAVLPGGARQIRQGVRASRFAVQWLAKTSALPSFFTSSTS